MPVDKKENKVNDKDKDLEKDKKLRGRNVNEEDEPEEVRKSTMATLFSKHKIIMIIVASIAVVGIAVGGYLLVSHHKIKNSLKGVQTKEVNKHDDSEKKDEDTKDDDSKEDSKKDEDKKEDDSKEDSDSNKSSDNAAESTGKPKSKYYAIEPPFVVNIQGQDKSRFLQVKVELMVKSKKISKSIEANLPLIKNDLINLFSSQTVEQMSTIAGKENLRAESLKKINAILDKEAEGEHVDTVLFTSFVMQ